MFEIVIAGLLIVVFLLTVTTANLKKDNTIKTIAIKNLSKQSDRYYDEKHDALANMHSFRRLYEDACEETSRLGSRISVLESELRDEEVSSGQLLEDKAKVIQELQDRLAVLRKTRECVSAGHLQSGLTYLMRFVAANQWMMENDMVFAEAVASVSEVAEAITERED